MENILKIKGIYKHFKNNYYILEDVAENSETGENYAVYRQLYGDNKLYIRPLDMFLSKVDKQKYPNVKQEYRFQYVSIPKKNELQ